MAWITTLVGVMLLAAGAQGWPQGAPNTGTVCTDLSPNASGGHGGASVSGASPVTITASPSTYTAGSTITVTLTGGFNGVMLVARKAGSVVPMGAFNTPPSGFKYVTCSSLNKGVITQDNKNLKNGATFTWVAPATSNGDITFKVTIVGSSKTTYWTGVASNKITPATTVGATTPAAGATTPAAGATTPAAGAQTTKATSGAVSYTSRAVTFPLLMSVLFACVV